jgi:hypothetical protein
MFNGQNFDWAPPVNDSLQDVPDWLLHFVYGAKIMDHYATKDCKDVVGKAMEATFYPDDKGWQDVEKIRFERLRNNTIEKRSQAALDRGLRYEGRLDKPAYLDLLDGLLGLNQVASYPAKEKQRQAHLARVDEWRQSVIHHNDLSHPEDLDNV